MLYVYKNKHGMYYCGNGVESNNLESAELFQDNIALLSDADFTRVSYEQELRKEKLLKIKEKYGSNVMS